MRADRLVGILLMLQRQGQVTAAQVAEEFEVSDRTARRDLDALGMAGFPVYSVQGRGGGWRLLGRGRTDLSGLSAAEVRALFLLAGSPAVTGEGPRSALRKLASALPDPLRSSAEVASRSLVVDTAQWDRAPTANRTEPPFLDAVQVAVVEQQELALTYVARSGNTTCRTVQPLGLAAKNGAWYLVADTDVGLRTFRVDRMSGADPTGRPATRPDDFDLTSAWSVVIDRVRELRLPLVARCRVQADVLRYLRFVVGDRLIVGEQAGDAWVMVEVRSRGLMALAADLAGFGAAVEVLEPMELRDRLATVGRELVEQYG